MTDPRPIGILDSGFGGLSVSRAIRQALPHEHLIYTADCGFAPWGDRPDDFIHARIDVLVKFLLHRNIKALVIACNTATAVCAKRLRSELSLPIIGIEPAVLPAARETKSQTIGVLATTKTLTSPKYQHLKTLVPSGIRVLDCPCPGLMDCVEAGHFDTPETMALLATYVKPLVNEGVDTLVLGCTHYPFLADAIQKTAGPSVHLLDPAPAVAKQLCRRLEALQLFNTLSTLGVSEFYTTDATPKRENILQLLTSRATTLHLLPT